MKTFKILFAAIIFVGFTTGLTAQQSDNDDITASATVVQPIVITGEDNLLFQDVAPGVAKTISFTDNVTAGTSVGGEQTGRFLVEAATNSHVTFNFSSLPQQLQIGEDGATMDISFTAAWGNTDDANELENDLEEISQDSGDTVEGVEGGEFHVFLGGTVTPENDQTAGEYTADITLTAEYN